MNLGLMGDEGLGGGALISGCVPNYASLGCHDFGFIFVKILGFPLLLLLSRSLLEVVDHSGRT